MGSYIKILDGGVQKKISPFFEHHRRPWLSNWKFPKIVKSA
jgi:hypothetical protein